METQSYLELCFVYGFKHLCVKWGSSLKNSTHSRTYIRMICSLWNTAPGKIWKHLMKPVRHLSPLFVGLYIYIKHILKRNSMVTESDGCCKRFDTTHHILVQEKFLKQSFQSKAKRKILQLKRKLQVFIIMTDNWNLLFRFLRLYNRISQMHGVYLIIKSRSFCGSESN